MQKISMPLPCMLILTVFVTVCIMLLTGVTSCIFSLSSPRDSSPIVDLAKYKTIRRKLPGPIGAHFPKKIPQNASQVRIFYDDNSPIPLIEDEFGQAEIWMKLKAGEAEQLLKAYKEQALQGKSFGWSDKPSGFNLVNGATADTWPPPWPPDHPVWRLESLPSDFVIIKLDNEGWKNWYRGVAISKRRGEIIYYGGYFRPVQGVH